MGNYSFPEGDLEEQLDIAYENAFYWDEEKEKDVYPNRMEVEQCER